MRSFRTAKCKVVSPENHIKRNKDCNSKMGKNSAYHVPCRCVRPGSVPIQTKWSLHFGAGVYKGLIYGEMSARAGTLQSLLYSFHATCLVIELSQSQLKRVAPAHQANQLTAESTDPYCVWSQLANGNTARNKSTCFCWAKSQRLPRVT